MTEVGVSRPSRDDQIVVWYFTQFIVDTHDAFLGIDLAHLRHQNFGIPQMTQYPADGSGDVARRQRRRRHLVQQRLKDEMIRPIDERDIDVGTSEDMRGGDSPEPAADDYDARSDRRVREVSPRTNGQRASSATPAISAARCTPPRFRMPARGAEQGFPSRSADSRACRARHSPRTLRRR